VIEVRDLDALDALLSSTAHRDGWVDRMQRHLQFVLLSCIACVLLAAAPAAVVQARYSQDFERQADDYGAALLLRNGMSPELLADALKKLAQSEPESSKSGYLSSHPSTDERMRHLRQLAASFTHE
jgi:predicted Zn-dependent protease